MPLTPCRLRETEDPILATVDETFRGFTLEWIAPDRCRMSGELDLASAPMLTCVLAASIDVPVLHIDCRRLRFIDVAGWRALSMLRRSLTPPTEICLCHPSTAAQRVLALLGHP